MPDLFIDRGADFSPCQQYRYRLWRIWDRSQPRLIFVMLNPSTADAERNDPTVERCQRRAEMGGYGGLIVMNVFAYRATDPKVMKAHQEPIGERNNETIEMAAAGTFHKVIAAWGHHATHLGRDAEVKAIFKAKGTPLYCLGTTKDGHPKHPLYVGYDVKPVLFQA